METSAIAGWSDFLVAAAGVAGALAGTLVALIPHLTTAQLGMVLAITALPTWILPMLYQLRSIRRRTYVRRWHATGRVFLHQVATLPGVLACVALHGALRGGLNWFAAGAIASILVAMFSAWILLIEILR